MSANGKPMSHVAWPSVRIDSVGQVQGGRQRSEKIVSGTMEKYLRVANVFDGFIDYSDVLKMPFTDSEKAIYYLESGDILLNEGQSLALVGRSAAYSGGPKEYCFQNTLIRFRPSAQITSDFALQVFRHYLHTGKFAAIAARTTSIAHLGVERFAALHVPLPSLPEQKAIAKVLSAWDRAIEHTTALIAAEQRLKQGLMQQLLTGKRRFRTFGDKWHHHELSDLCEAVKRKNGSTTTRVLTASGEHGMVDQLDYFHRSVAGRDIAEYYLLQRGEFAYNRSLMNGYPYGAIKRLDKYEHGALSTLYLCFAVKRNACDSDFMAQLFEGGVLNSQLRGIVQVGGRAHGLLNVTASEFFAMTVRLPESEEQRRIAEVLKLVDNEKALHRRRLEELKKQKRGLMQQLLTGKVRVSESLLRKGAAT